jgi:tRNA(Ile)-lysidine synthase TilS/MesJ
MKALSVPYFYESQRIVGKANALLQADALSSVCSFCSRMKRGRLYACARREGYNVLAFGQHLDDLAESFVMSAFHNGLLRTMKAHYTVGEGDLRMIRPLVHVREIELRKFSEVNE